MANRTPIQPGNTFGRWTVIREAGKASDRSIRWLCRCACGQEGTVRAFKLRNGRSLSCGCLAAEMTSDRLTTDLIGRTFSSLTVVARQVTKGRTHWECRCTCGSTTVVDNGNLTSGHTKSCGCLYEEAYRARRGVPVTESPTYRTVHTRLTKWRGKANNHQCVDCDQRADQWSYDHSDPDPRSERSGNNMLPFSTDLSRYQPRCNSCHTAFDRAHVARQLNDWKTQQKVG